MRSNPLMSVLALGLASMTSLASTGCTAETDVSYISHIVTCGL